MDKEEALENLESEGIYEEDLEIFEGKAPKEREFPFLFFSLGAIKDVVDCCDGAGIIGSIVGVFVWIILFFYMWGKISFVRKRLYKKYVFGGAIAIIWGANVIIPESSGFVLLTYLQEKKQFKQIIEYFEMVAFAPEKVL